MNESPRRTPWIPVLLSATLTAALLGCASTRPLMPTPVLYTAVHGKELFTEVPAEQETPPLDLLYITDRATATSEKDTLPYTADRSRSMAFGSVEVEFGDDVSWDALAHASTQSDRDTPVHLELGSTRELGRYPAIPYDAAVSPAGIQRAPATVDAHEEASRLLQGELARRLAAAPRKELVLYVHGYHNTYEDSALTMGELCHFLGREFVCGIFTWPAGGDRGVLMGYNVDYESSVFAAEHLRKALRTLAHTPGLERIHVLAHSRGTGLTATAISELAAEAYMQETTLARAFKVGHVVLMAPDIDADVAPSTIFKILSDPELPHGAEAEPRAVIKPQPELNLTVYASPNDKALATSSYLFGSVARLGLIRPEAMSPHSIEQIRKLGFFDVVQVFETTDFFGHGYFVSNPRVSSDIVAMLRYGLKPNEPGRPLVEIERPFWRVLTPKELEALDSEEATKTADSGP